MQSTRWHRQHGRSVPRPRSAAAARVTLKCPSDSEHQSSEVQARIMREARAAARLTHPNIAAVYDVLEHDGRMFIDPDYDITP